MAGKVLIPACDFEAVLGKLGSVALNVDDLWWITLRTNGRKATFSYHTRPAEPPVAPTREDVLIQLLLVEANGYATLGLREFMYDRAPPKDDAEAKARLTRWRDLRKRRRQLRRLFGKEIVP